MANTPFTYVPYSIPSTMPFYLGIIGIIVAGIVAFIIGFLIMRILVYNRDPLLSHIAKGGLLGLIYDIDSNRYELLPIEKHGDIYVVPSSVPSVFVKGSGDLPVPIKGTRAQLFLGFKKSLTSMVTKPESLALFSISKIVIGGNELSTTSINDPKAVTQAIISLANMDTEKKYTVKLSSDSNIGMVFSPNELAVKLIEEKLDQQRTLLNIANYVYGTGKSAETLLDRLFNKLKPSSAGAWRSFLILVLLIVMIFGVIMLVLSHGTTSTSTVAHTVTAIKTTTS